MSFITGLGYFVSWGNYNEQTCFPFLDVVISELLITAPEYVDKHIKGFWLEWCISTTYTMLEMHHSSQELSIYDQKESWLGVQPVLFMWGA